MATKRRTGRTNGTTTNIPTFNPDFALKALEAIGATYEEVRMHGGPSLLVGWKGDNLLVAFKPMRKWAQKWKGNSAIHASDWATLFKGIGVGLPLQNVVMKKLGKAGTKVRRGPGRPRLHPAPEATTAT